MSKKFSFWLDAPSIVLAAVMGFVSVVLPPYLIPDGIKQRHEAPLFPVIATASANFAFFPSALALFFSGFILGFIRPHIWWILGLSTMLLFPIADMLETLVAPTSHNLWPFQVFFDVILSTPAILGAFLGRVVRTEGWREWF
jgi:hypothetical protein